MVLYHQTIMGSPLGSNHELFLTSAGKVVEQGHDDGGSSLRSDSLRGSRKPPHACASSQTTQEVGQRDWKSGDQTTVRCRGTAEWGEVVALI